MATSSITFDDTGQNDVQILLGYFVRRRRFPDRAGLRELPDQADARPPGGHPRSRELDEPGLGKYFRVSTDHKIVSMQYIVGIGIFFFIGGLNAMLIRTELLSPTTHVFGANQYLTIVGLHGSMMMGMMTSGILGPFANWVVPLMIGSRRMAFPRIEALTFWLLMAAGVILLIRRSSSAASRPAGPVTSRCLTRGPPASTRTSGSSRCVGLSMCLLGLNLMVTIVTMRAPGLTWSRLPIFCWSVVATCVLMVLASPMLIACLLMGAMDRTASETAFFVPGKGGSAQLYQNLFWVFGHPEVYMLAIPGFGIVLELLPVFTRKPLWGYRTGCCRHDGCRAAQLLRLAAPPVRQRHRRRPAAVLHALHGDRSRCRPASRSCACSAPCGADGSV